MDKLPEIVVGQQGAVDVARHPDAVATVTGIVGQQPPVNALSHCHAQHPLLCLSVLQT